MTAIVGVLLPRSTDFPAMGLDILDGLKCYLSKHGMDEVRFISESIGFGEDSKEIYAKAEKCILQDDAQVVIGYLSADNAASLYPLFENTGRYLIALDPGMNYPGEARSLNALHISLQGIHACYLAGKKAGSGARDVIFGTSFFDGGYRGPWAYARGIEGVGGKVVSNFIGHYKENEFAIEPMIEALNTHRNATVAACFSTYLATTFFKKLSREDLDYPETEFYCSSFMGEEQTMLSYSLPKGKFFTYVPWFSELETTLNKEFVAEIQTKKNKRANVFHLLGWEAGILLHTILSSPEGMASEFNRILSVGSYESPRGFVQTHSSTHSTFSPLYYCEMHKSEDEGVKLTLLDTQKISSEEHLQVLSDQPEGVTSGWFNNYLCT